MNVPRPHPGSRAALRGIRPVRRQRRREPRFRPIPQGSGIPAVASSSNPKNWPSAAHQTDLDAFGGQSPRVSRRRGIGPAREEA